jgi:hypothetical protein
MPDELTRPEDTASPGEATSTREGTPPDGPRSPAESPTSMTREELLAQHADARHRRNAAALGSEAYVEAVAEISRLEVRIASLERSMDPPRM